MFHSFAIAVYDIEKGKMVKTVDGECMLTAYKEITEWMAESAPARFWVATTISMKVNGTTVSNYVNQEFQTIDGVPTLVK
jgi:hypothetical protein